MPLKCYHFYFKKICLILVSCYSFRKHTQLLDHRRERVTVSRFPVTV
jgi:hypothetical protein